MKNLALFAFSIFAGCADITQYISFNDKDKSVNLIRMEFPVISEFPPVELPEGAPSLDVMTTSLTNYIAPDTMNDTRFKGSARAFSNETLFGSETRFEGPKLSFPLLLLNLPPHPSAFSTMPERRGFSIYFGKALASAERDYYLKEYISNKDREEAKAITMVFRYRVILSKASLRFPLKSVTLHSPEGPQDIPFRDYGRVYWVETGLLPILNGAEKLEFRF